jgi:hypothetical protein
MEPHGDSTAPKRISLLMVDDQLRANDRTHAVMIALRRGVFTL